MRALALLREAARDAALLWRLSPVVALLAIVPEFLQHVAEIKLGMFASHAAFQELAMAPERWWWGYWKLAGLTAAALGGAWYLLRREGLGPIQWPRLLLALGLNIAVSALTLGLTGWLGQAAGGLVAAGLSIATLPLMPLLAGAIAGDAQFTLGRAYRSGWWIALRSILLLAAGFLPLQGLHTLNHRLALGLPDAGVWALMGWDSLVVGVMATWMAAAIARGFLGTPLAKR